MGTWGREVKIAKPNNQIEILELKNLISEVKNLRAGLYYRYDTTIWRNDEIEDHINYLIWSYFSSLF